MHSCVYARMDEVINEWMDELDALMDRWMDRGMDK